MVRRFFRRYRRDLTLIEAPKRFRPLAILGRLLGQPVKQPLRVPMPRLEWPRFTEPPVTLPPLPPLPAVEQLSAKLPAVELPRVELPVVPFVPVVSAGEPETGSGPQWPALPSVRCPIDVLSLITRGPRLDLGVEPDRGET